MYADTGLLFPYLQNFSQDIQQLEEYCKYQKTNASMNDMIPTSMISEFDLGGEGDLFKAPEPIIEEQITNLDPMTSAISMISCGDDVISPQGLKVSDIESIQTEELLNEVFYGCEKDLMKKANIETPISEILDIRIPGGSTDGIFQIEESKVVADVALPKSVSSGCLASMEWINGHSGAPSFLDFSTMDPGNAYGMRRAYSEGDIKTLAEVNSKTVQSPIDRSLVIGGSSIAEQRREQLTRYRNKKTKRNFGRKIKYACRKALADSQPRIRGRFAKTEESDVSKRQ